MEKALMIAGGNPSEMQKESKEAAIAEQFEQAGTAPGVVSPGAYGNAFSQLGAMAHTSGTWHEATRMPYNADDKRYCSSRVTGRCGTPPARPTPARARSSAPASTGWATR